jgi:hypothetical protein
LADAPNPPRYRIEVPYTGGVVVEAPTKDECLELYRKVSRTPQKTKIDEAIR